MSQCLRWLYLGFWKAVDTRNLSPSETKRLPWNPPTRALKDKAEHVCSLWTHTHTHTFPTLSQHLVFIFALTCRVDLPSSRVSGLHCLNWARVGRRSPPVSLFDFLSRDSPLWRPRVSCRKSTYDACMCVMVVVVVMEREWEARRGGQDGGELRLKGEEKIQMRAKIEAVQFLLIIRIVAKSETCWKWTSKIHWKHLILQMIVCHFISWIPIFLQML